MPTRMNQQTPDFELDPIQEARLYAQNLRKTSDQAVADKSKGYMMGPYWIRDDDRGDNLKSMVGAGLDYFGGQKEAELGAQRETQFKDWMDQRPNMMTDQTVPGLVRPEDPNNPDEAGQGAYQAPTTTERVMKPYQQQQQEQMNWATQGAQIKHPLAQSMAARGLQESWDIPEKGMAREEAATQRKFILEQTMEGRAQLAREKMAADAKLAADKAAAKVEADAKEANLRRELAAGRTGTQDLQRQFIQGKIDVQKEKASAAKEGKAADAQNALDYLGDVRKNVLELYDPETKALKPTATSIFGRVDQYRPPILQSEAGSNAISALASLKDQLTMTNLADAKRRVGQSFGSMQVKEWDKFLNQLNSLDRNLGEKKAAENLAGVLSFLDRNEAVLRTALGGTAPGASAGESAGQPPAGITAAEWGAMTPAERKLFQ